LIFNQPLAGGLQIKIPSFIFSVHSPRDIHPTQTNLTGVGQLFA
jgi:hypothetical protein